MCLWSVCVCLCVCARTEAVVRNDVKKKKKKNPTHFTTPFLTETDRWDQHDSLICMCAVCLKNDTVLLDYIDKWHFLQTTAEISQSAELILKRNIGVIMWYVFYLIWTSRTYFCNIIAPQNTNLCKFFALAVEMWSINRRHFNASNLSYKMYIYMELNSLCTKNKKLPGHCSTSSFTYSCEIRHCTYCFKAHVQVFRVLQLYTPHQDVRGKLHTLRK